MGATQDDRATDESFVADQRLGELRLKVWEAQRPQHVEMFKAVIESGLSALKSAILLNGGAAIALLAFLGSVTSKTSGPSMTIIGPIGLAMMQFFLGAGLAGVAMGARYVSQFFYAEQMKPKAGRWITGGAYTFHILAFATGATSFCLFFRGGYLANAAFQMLKV